MNSLIALYLSKQTSSGIELLSVNERFVMAMQFCLLTAACFFFLLSQWQKIHTKV